MTAPAPFVLDPLARDNAAEVRCCAPPVRWCRWSCPVASPPGP